MNGNFRKTFAESLIWFLQLFAESNINDWIKVQGNACICRQKRES